MALAEAVLNLAGEMDKMAGDEKSILGFSLRSFALALRTAVEASRGDECRNVTESQAASPEKLLLEEQAARLDLWRQKKRILREENDSIFEAGGVLEVADGPDAGDMIVLDTPLSVGARRFIGMNVYEFRADGKLHYVSFGTNPLAETP